MPSPVFFIVDTIVATEACTKEGITAQALVDVQVSAGARIERVVCAAGFFLVGFVPGAAEDNIGPESGVDRIVARA